MKAFRFRLETLLHLREISRDKALGHYAQSIRSRQEREKALQVCQSHLESLHAQIGERRKNSLV